MPWLQLETKAGQERPEQLEPALEELGAVAIWLRDAGDEPILEPAPGATPQWSSTIVTALFPSGTSAAELAGALAGVVDASELQFAIIEDRDWQAEWQTTLQPQCFGDRLWVVPDNCRIEHPGTVVEMSPGLAFGSGEHPTTAMCLEWLTRLNLAGRSVLDYGCGSGLLAIAALALGAESASGVDIDPQALDATRNNAVKNSCLDRLEVCQPAETGTRPRYDVLVANILSGTLIDLGAQIGSLMRANAPLALTGILAEQANDVRIAWADWAELEIGNQIDDWVLLTGRKRGIQD